MILSTTEFKPTPEFWAICTLIITSISKGIYDYFKRYQDNKEKENLRKAVLEDREEVRKDLANQAELMAKGFETINDNGVIRLKAIISSNVTTRDFAKQAIRESNGIKKDLMTKGVKLIEEKPNENNI